MRRLLAILLLAASNTPLLILPAFAQTDPELPPCCRIAGKHKCALKHARQYESSGPSIASVGDRCPFVGFSGASGLNLHPFLLTGTSDAVHHVVVISAARICLHRITLTAPGRAHYKRGPPLLLT
ncbi:MAG TPA: hypothetical protein VH601_17500 [Bryobacteraceae bacterium]